MSDSEESMEVTLSTEAERGASGFTITGGREQGIIVSQVLKESPHSDIFCIKEGDQLLSATIYFDDITYEDALKILQQSEPYKVQFNLKRKLEKEDREKMHSVIQNKPEKQKQDNGDQVYSFKTTEGDKTVRKREHKKKRSKKDRLSWPKFQSITTTGFLGHRSSRSTSETNDEETQDTSRVSELHSEQEDISIKQYEREFPGMELQCRKTASGEQILELETKKQADPQRRLKEKRSLDSSISVKIDHHSVPKTQLRKGESLHSYISTDKSKDKKENIQNVIWRETLPEVIIVKEKTLPSPCKVSPIQKRDQTTILQSSAEERINELSQQTDLGQQVCDVLTHPKDETMMSKQRKKKSKKTILGSTRAQVDDTCEAHSSSSHLNIEFHPFSGNNTEENNIPEDEKVSTSCVAFKRLVNDDAMNEFQTEPSKHYASAKINNTCEFAELQHKNVAEKVESSLSGTEPTSDKGLPGRQHVLSGWKLQMPIIKMPKLPKLQRKSFRSENVEHSNINTTNIRSEGKDSVIIADVPILSTLLTDTASSRTKNIESNKIPVVSYIPKNKEPVATGDIIHQKTILKQKCVQPHLDKNQSDLNIHFLDTEKENYTLLEGERVDKENIHVLYNPVQLPLQDEGSDKLVTKKIKLNTDMMSEIPVPELDMPVTDILSPGQTLPEEAFIEDNANDSNIRLKYEFMCEPNDNESREALLKKPTLKMSSFDTITQKVKDSSEKDYKTIIDLNKDGKKGIVKVKLPKVELSLPQFRGPKGHYKVHTNTDSQSSDNINDVYNKWTFSEELKHDSQLSSYSKHEIKIEKDGVFDNVPTEADINISFIKKNTLEVSENKVNETSEEIDANDTVDFAKDINIIFPHMQIAKYCECISDNNEKETEQKSRTDFKLKKDISTNVSEEKKIIHELKKQDGEKGEQENTITVTSSITGGFSQELDLDNNDISKPQKLKYTPTTNTLQGTNANIDINSDTSEYGTVYSGIHTTISDEKKVSEERKPLKVHSSEMNSEVEVLHSKLEERKGVKITEIPKTIISTERQVKEKTSLTQQFLSSNMKRDFKVADISCSLSPTIEELKSKNEAETVENKIVKKDVFMKVSVERMDIAKKYEDMPIIQPKTKILETVKETSIHEIQPPTSSKPDISHSEQVGESVKEFLSLSVESEPITVSKEEVTVELKQEEERPKPDTDSIQSLEIQKDVKESEVVQKELSIHVKPSVVEHWEVQGKGKRHRKKVTKVEKTIITTENQETGVTSPLEGYTSETKTEFEIEDIDDTLSPTEQELKPQEEMVETATITTETTETKLFLTMSEDRVDTAVTAQETLITEPTIQILQSVTELTICETQLPTSTVLTLSTTEQTDLAGGTEEIPQHKEDIKVDSEEKRRETSQDTQATEPKAEILEVSEERVDTARTTQETEITEPKTQILETVIEVSVPETQLPTLSTLHFVQSDQKAIPDSSIAMPQPKGDIQLELEETEAETTSEFISTEEKDTSSWGWGIQLPAFKMPLFGKSDKPADLTETEDASKPKEEVKHEAEITERETVIESLSLSVESEPTTVLKEEVTVELQQEEERPKPDTDSIQSLEIQKDIKESEVVQKELSIQVEPSVEEHWEVQGKGKRHRKKVTKVEKTVIATEYQETGLTSPLEGYTSETKTEFEIEDIDDTLSPTEEELKTQEEMAETATITTETTETKLFLTMSEDRVDTAVTAQEILITEPTIQILQTVTELTICETQLPTSTVLTLSTTEQTGLAGGTEEIPQHKEDSKVDSEEKERETTQDTQVTEPKAEILEVSEERVDTARTTQETEITEPKTQILETVMEVSVPETQLPTLSTLHFVQSDQKAIPDSSVAMPQPKGDIQLELEETEAETTSEFIITEEKDTSSWGWGIQLPAFKMPLFGKSDKPADLTETEDASKPKEEVKHEAEITERETVIESLSLSVESEPTTVLKEEVTVELQQEEERPKPDTDSIQSLEIQKDIKESEVVQKELSIQVEPSVEEHWEVQGKGKRHRKKVTKVEKTVIATEYQETGLTSPLEGYTSETKTEFEIEDIDDTLSPTEEELKTQEEMAETATITTETTETKLFLTMSEDRVDTAVTAQEILITEPTIQILQTVTELTICETQLPTSTVLTLSTTEQTDLAGGTEEIPQHKEDSKVDSEEKERETIQDTQATEPKAEILEVSEERVDTPRTTQETEITEPKTQILETVKEVSVPETQLPTLSTLHFVQSDQKAIPDSSVAMPQPKGDIQFELEETEAKTTSECISTEEKETSSWGWGIQLPAFKIPLFGKSDKPADLTETEDASKPKEEVKHEAEITERETVIESLSLSVESEPTTVSKEEVTVELQQEEERPKPDTDSIQSLEIQKDIKESEVVQKELSIQVEPSVEEHWEVQGKGKRRRKKVTKVEKTVIATEYQETGVTSPLEGYTSETKTEFEIEDIDETLSPTEEELKTQEEMEETATITTETTETKLFLTMSEDRVDTAVSTQETLITEPTIQILQSVTELTICKIQLPTSTVLTLSTTEQTDMAGGTEEIPQHKEDSKVDSEEKERETTQDTQATEPKAEILEVSEERVDTARATQETEITEPKTQILETVIEVSVPETQLPMLSTLHFVQSDQKAIPDSSVAMPQPKGDIQFELEETEAKTTSECISTEEKETSTWGWGIQLPAFKIPLFGKSDKPADLTETEDASKPKEEVKHEAEITERETVIESLSLSVESEPTTVSKEEVTVELEQEEERPKPDTDSIQSLEIQKRHQKNLK
ncbi:titin homolog [Xenopus laevis]|uniref:Titin homolog n=1 Tax=Xenopus laevis TaxID=8355 RepID=A0A8J0TLX0_XENLA|nr:titin homolog [Xenopus laevis]